VDVDLPEFERRTGYTFQRRDLLTRAITHKSYSHEARHENVRHNETFEFFGDSVLGFVIGDMLFRNFPDLDEGALSKMKAYLVSATSLAEKARAFGMGDVILLGVGEEKTGGRKKDSLLANLFEAMLAGIYLDGGIEHAGAGCRAIGALSAALSGRLAWDRVLREVSLVLPDDVWLTSLSATAPSTASGTSSAGFSINGRTYSHDGVARLLARLSVVPHLSNIQLQHSTIAVSDSGRQLVEFSLNATVKAAGSA